MLTVTEMSEREFRQRIILGFLVLILVVALPSAFTYGLFFGFHSLVLRNVWGSLLFGIGAFAIVWIPFFLFSMLFITMTKTWDRLPKALNFWRFVTLLAVICALGVSLGAISTQMNGPPDL